MDASEPNVRDCTPMWYRKALSGPTALGTSTEYFNAYSIVGKKNILLPSDRDGFMHLYLYDMNGKLLRQVEKGNYGVPPFTFEENGLPTFMESDKIYASAIIVNGR